MLVVQINGQTFDPLSLAGPRHHLDREDPLVELSAMGAQLDEDSMFCHFQLQDRKVKDLSPFLSQSTSHFFQRGPTAQALLGLVLDDMVRHLYLLERCTWMTRLSPGLLCAGLTQAAGLLAEAIAGRRLAAIVAIGSQPAFKLFDPGRQTGNILLLLMNLSLLVFKGVKQPLDQLNHGLRPKVVEAADFVAVHHLTKLSGFSLFVCCFILKLRQGG